MSDRPTTAEECETVDEEFSLDDIADGSGCTEIWEYLSERREAND